MGSSQQFSQTIETEEGLRTIIGFPSKLVKNKVITYLDPHCSDFISKSPFLVISTADESGCCDASPRGDKPGFVHVLDEKHLIIPERPGNRRIDSMRNILSNPGVGLLFIIPGMEETLRINGKATLVKDEGLLEKMKIKDRKPLLGIGVEVEECFIHCAKAFKRSNLWEPNSWPDNETLPSASKILSAHSKISLALH
ncbi:pyridoxamine 5'-phosphate oxidase family protein [Siminovitchia fortis]|uniref:Pyridoxamine 5'-phosphate oxidase family protein n=1 Tax=Siminovitchia fortis TaxID=254758 RepID=A0A443IIJ8_9BACI|nr:pyridoxamine 5'-phosphate oxidase family protein [Siminovitchia fortis]RWR03995.1 pyridoxamine 5'-phosphate oxidase family protein [Siminovitchia fortis]WHY82575.1 pyridoxamine 5'-phosphate oxidase family protein [Siminovitchia fortis]